MRRILQGCQNNIHKPKEVPGNFLNGKCLEEEANLHPIVHNNGDVYKQKYKRETNINIKRTLYNIPFVN